MANESFQELTDRLEKELIRLHYADTSILQYRRMWNRIAAFFEQEGFDRFTDDAGMCFLDKQFNFFELEKAGKLTQSIVNVFRVVRMLGDFQQHNSILRRYYKQKELLHTDEFKKISQSYQQYCQQRDYSVVTKNHYRKIPEEFLSFLESQGIKHTPDILAKHISDYIKTLLGYSYKTVELRLCGLRSFLRFLLEYDLHTEDLAKTVPPLKARKQNRIPSVWTRGNVLKLIKAIDRGNPAGKRDYAIILLVTRLGLRTIDIKHLLLSNLKWQDNRIEFQVYTAF